MISPEFRETVKIDMQKNMQKFIEQNHGTELWLSLQPSIAEVEKNRFELCNANLYKCDVE